MGKQKEKETQSFLNLVTLLKKLYRWFGGFVGNESNVHCLWSPRHVSGYKRGRSKKCGIFLKHHGYNISDTNHGHSDSDSAVLPSGLQQDSIGVVRQVRELPRWRRELGFGVSDGDREQPEDAAGLSEMTNSEH
ncbi:unnamed protein product [Citrullus colocynthis]|uniref:Uncharacterized protein n=1 Tax=Citrullus colocynthis TaxID=252529 RepID=A0ABP0YXA2_9ROSI